MIYYRHNGVKAYSDDGEWQDNPIHNTVHVTCYM